MLVGQQHERISEHANEGHQKIRREKSGRRVFSEAQKIFLRDLCEMQLWADFERWLALIATQQPYYIMYVCEMGLAARRALISTQNNSKSTATRRVGRNYPPRAEDNLSGNLHTTPTGCHAGAKCVCLMIMPPEKEKVLSAKTFAGEKSGFRSALSAARARRK